MSSAPKRISPSSNASSVLSLESWAREQHTRIHRLRRSKAQPQGPSSTGASQQQTALDLLDFIPEMNPTWVAPRHLEPLAKVLRRIAAGESVRIVVATPPRHGKTETLLHFIVWALKQHPDWTFGYASYAEDIAFAKARTALDLAIAQNDLELRSKALGEWRTTRRGGMLTRGIGGGLTGMGINVGIVDDPVKDRLQAESVTYRERTWSWFTDVFFTRIEPGGSVIVNMARWHPDDLAGRLVRELGWEYLCLPAINEAGEALWPDRWTVPLLLERKRTLGQYGWESLYQGRPRPRDGKLFGDPWGYVASELPLGGRYAIGLDLSYSAKTSSDWSVAVVMKRVGIYWYVVHVERLQVRAPQFAAIVKALWVRYGKPPIRWYASGTEQGVGDFMNSERGLPIEVLPPKGDKFVRAQPYAAQWNDGRVLLQEGADWTDEVVSEHVLFTGLDGGRDDVVDASVAAFDVLNTVVQYPPKQGTREQRRM